MRKKRNAEDTRMRVLESAERLFADKGYNGTSLKEISDMSGISNGLILYHFNSKEQLYREVLESISQRYAKVMGSLRSMNLPPSELMIESIEAVFNFWKSDTAYNRISLWAYLENRKEMSDSETRLTGGLAEYIKALQNAGYLSKDFHPAVFLSMIIGPIHFWFRYKQRFAEVLKLKETEDELDNIFITQFSKTLAGFLESPEPDGHT